MEENRGFLMGKANESATEFLKKNKKKRGEKVEFKESFDVVNPASRRPLIGLHLSVQITEKERRRMELVLLDYFNPLEKKEKEVGSDLERLVDISSEIKSIASQSVILHGERIKKAQDILGGYREGAFSKWLLQTYGNRQTPYSMLQYYELYMSLSKKLQPKLEIMPKKAAYTLASRYGELSKKCEIINGYSGEKQKEVILTIQEAFPMSKKDKRRRKDIAYVTITEIEQLCFKLEKRKEKLSKESKKWMGKLIIRLKNLCV